MNAALLSSEKMDWETPDNVLELVRQIAPIGLDPCTTLKNPTGAMSTYIRHGLQAPWDTCPLGLVYCNPPYGRELPAWTRKMRDSSDGDIELIGLVPARPDTRWWHQNITTADAICFWRGRLKFKGAPSAAPFPSALPYWGPRPERFREVFGPHGWIV